MGSRPENSSSDDGGAFTVAIVAVALAAWGISKCFGRSKRQEKMTSSFTERDQDRNGNTITYGQQQDDKWTRPKQGWFKLNTDASARTQDREDKGPAAAGGVIRDDAGQWMVGFTANLGELDCTHAELEAVREGLLLARKRGFTRLEVETDCKGAVELIKKRDIKNSHRLCEVVQDCRKLLKELDADICDVKKEKNNVADALANIGRFQNERLLVWEITSKC